MYIIRGEIIMKYKAYCTDLDGTLLNSKSELSRKNAEAIKEIADMGVFFVPTSGRTIQEMPSKLVDDPAIRYIIYSNGAGVLDKETGKRDEELIDGKTVERILSVMRDFPSLLAIHKSTECFIDGEGVLNRNKYKINDAYIEIFKRINVIEHSFEGFIREAGAIEMFIAFFGVEVDEDECIKRLSQIPGIYITSSCDGNIEIISEHANKGNGIRRFAKMAGISREEIISSGDGRNDIALLEAAGLPLAVSNAKPELKEKARYIICSCNDHVAEYVLENYLRND